MLRGNIRVVCRARPGAEQSVLAFPAPGAITVYPPDRAIKEFEFNACFGPESSQVGQPLQEEPTARDVHVCVLWPTSPLSATQVMPQEWCYVLPKGQVFLYCRLVLVLCRRMCGSMWRL